MIPFGSLTKPLDVVLLVRSVLHRLDSGGIKTFEQRLKTQKLQYFAQLFDVSPPYNFNLYLRGPYSPHLAHDFFEVQEININEPLKFASNEVEERFAKLHNFVDGRSIRELEIIATLHWLIKVAGLSKAEATKKLYELKKTSTAELEKAFNAFEVLPK